MPETGVGGFRHHLGGRWCIRVVTFARHPASTSRTACTCATFENVSVTTTVRAGSNRLLRVAMHGGRRERGQAHGDVLGAVGLGAAVADPLTGGRDDSLPRTHVERAAFVL